MLDFKGALRRRRLPASIQETLLHLLLAAVISVSVLTFPLHFIEAPLYDLRQWWSSKPKIDDRIALVTLDDQTLNQLNEVSPLPLKYHLKAVQEFERHEVRAVGYAIDFNKVQRIDDPGFNSEGVQEFYRSTVRLNAQGIPFLLGIPYEPSGEVSAPYPLNQIPQSVAVIHKDGATFGKDKVTRRALLSLYEKPAYEMALANRIFSNDTILNPPGTFKSSETEAQYFRYRLHQNEGIIYDSEYETFAYPRYSFVDLIEGKIPEGTLKDKIILVGTFQRDNPSDFTLISSLDHFGHTPKLLIQANILDSILNQQGLKEVPSTALAIVCFLLSMVIVIASFRIRPSRLIALTLFLLVGISLVSVLIFQPVPFIGSFWLPLGAPFLSLTLSFYLMIPLRLYSEHRKRYALEKENQILHEVEELKTNFIQLVTHDLKTPVARIQGLTEQLARSLGDRLATQDRETIGQLLTANHELNSFIGSLLELTRLDSHGLRVSLQSRDVNPLLEQVIEKLRFQARSKNIQLITDFEPLFPIRIDPDLVAKVLSNLIDNAIKYSPEHTSVYVSSREVGDRVCIVIRDQGIGIPEAEIPNLFSRFYRIKNDATLQVKGTGLGLYLSKYFIEAHRGTIEVESKAGEGTTFTLTLPVDLKDRDVVQPGLRTDLKIQSKRIRKETHYA